MSWRHTNFTVWHPPFPAAILLNNMASVYPIPSRSKHQVVLALWDLHVRPHPSYASCILTSTASARIHLKDWASPASPTNCKGLQATWLPPRAQRPPACTVEPFWVQTPDIHPTKVLPPLPPPQKSTYCHFHYKSCMCGKSISLSTIHILV